MLTFELRVSVNCNTNLYGVHVLRDIDPTTTDDNDTGRVKDEQYNEVIATNRHRKHTGTSTTYRVFFKGDDRAKRLHSPSRVLPAASAVFRVVEGARFHFRT